MDSIITEMSVEDHRKAAPASVRCAVITISDTRTAATDSSGDAIAEALTQAGHMVDDATHRAQMIRTPSATVVRTAAADVPVIVTTGGTGITSRDSTYEAIVGAARQAPRRIRRAVPHAQLRADRVGGDAEPRVRGHDRHDRDLRAARIRDARSNWRWKN